jgi:hypothetical protein
MMLEEGYMAGGSLWEAGDAHAVVRRVRYATPVAGGLAVVGALLLGGAADALGVVVGTALAVANFRFLHSSLRSILDAGHERAPSGTTLMFVFRWLIVATIAFGVCRTEWASISGVFFGLFTPAAAIGFEAAFQVYHAIRHGDEPNDNDEN